MKNKQLYRIRKVSRNGRYFFTLRQIRECVHMEDILRSQLKRGDIKLKQERTNILSEIEYLPIIIHYACGCGCGPAPYLKRKEPAINECAF
jgi:hypothetical protein